MSSLHSIDGLAGSLSDHAKAPQDGAHRMPRVSAVPRLKMPRVPVSPESVFSREIYRFHSTGLISGHLER